MMSNKPLKIEIRKDVPFRDVLYTLDSVFTTIGSRIGEDFSNTTLYPAIESNMGEMTSGAVSSEAKKLSTPLKLILSGDITGSVVFDGSEGCTTGVTLNNSLISINGTPITNIFDTDGFVYGSNILGKVKTSATGTKTLVGTIADTNLTDLFEYSEDTGVMIGKKSIETKQFDDYRYIKLEGDLVGGLRNYIKEGTTETITNGSNFELTYDPEITTGVEKYNFIKGYVNIEQYIPTSNKLAYEWKNPTTNVVEYVSEMTTDISAHLNAVNYFVYTIDTTKFSKPTEIDDESFFFVQPNVSNITDYETYSKMNMVVKYDTDNKWKIYCYTNSVVPNMKLVKIMKFGKIEDRS